MAAKKAKPRAHRPRELTLLLVVQQGPHPAIQLVRGALPATATKAPASGLLWGQLGADGHLGFQEAQWQGWDALAPIIRDAVFAACGDPEAVERVTKPQLAFADGVPQLYGANGATLLRRGGRA